MTLSFERSNNTDAIVVILRGVNDEISYKALAQRTSVRVETVKSCIASARRILRKERIVFGTIRGEGLRRLGDTDKVRKSENNKKRIARSAGRALKELETIEQFDKLSNVDQLTASTNRMIFSMTSKQLATKIEPPKPLPQVEAPSTENVVKLVKGSQS